MTDKKLILYLSPTGLSPTRESIAKAGLNDIQLPYEPEQIARTTVEVWRYFAGLYGEDFAMLVHTHIRDENGVDTLSPEKFEQLQHNLKEQGVSVNSNRGGVGLLYTSSVPNADIPVFERAKHILNAPSQYSPLGGTGLWGDFEFGRSKFFNPPEQMAEYANKLNVRGMLLENELMIFSDDPSEDKKTDTMLELLGEAIKSNVFKNAPYVNIVVGPSGLSYEHISKKVGEITTELNQLSSEAGHSGKPIIIIGGAISPEETLQLASEHNLDGIRFGAGECRSNPNCTWADSSINLAKRVSEKSSELGVSFTNGQELYEKLGVSGLTKFKRELVPANQIEI